MVTRDHEGNYNYQGLGFAELNAKPSEDPNTPRLDPTAERRSRNPSGRRFGHHPRRSPDSTLSGIWGENPGALCPQTPADRLRLWIVSKLNRLGMIPAPATMGGTFADPNNALYPGRTLRRSPNGKHSPGGPDEPGPLPTSPRPFAFVSILDGSCGGILGAQLAPPIRCFSSRI